MVAFLLTLIKELLPFLKEALLEGQSFKVWLRSNWLTFTCLVSTLIMTFSIAYLAEMLVLSHRQIDKSQETVNQLKVPLENFVRSYRKIKAENDSLERTVTQLRVEKAVQDERLAKYEKWMGDCGVNLTTGQCRIVRPQLIKPQTTRPRRKPASAIPKPPAETVPPKDEKVGFFKKIRSMFRRENEE